MNARHPSEANLHVNNRINELLAISNERRVGRRPSDPCERESLLARARLAVGHRLISFGSVVAGQHA